VKLNSLVENDGLAGSCTLQGSPIACIRTDAIDVLGPIEREPNPRAVARFDGAESARRVSKHNAPCKHTERSPTAAQTAADVGS
jgi:hypothetical protein